ncbi:unnamed protein product [Caenorhabditis auriculariae]|uniref:SAM-dependent MTase TRM10-type domain-containing protein n=1 Tax=Caenorhabditis auriculariae TaxID=2777116 RepID=A0A8S1GN60_9PELO|nr:unnamed protein product [Caenorhabditis auriculariae]
MLRCFCTIRSFSCSISRFSNEKSCLPSPVLVNKFSKKRWQREKLAQVTSEVKLYADVFGREEIENISDALYKEMMSIADWRQRRQCLLDHQRLKRSFKLKTQDSQLVSEVNQRKHVEGEMTYARHFHSLLDIYGAEFRKQIDKMYGARLLREDVPSLLIDCRFLRDFSRPTQQFYLQQMQALHEWNWFSRRPFELHFVNFRPDPEMAEMSQRVLKFFYGHLNPATNEFLPTHPLTPTLTTRRIKEVVQEKDDIMYISPRARRSLPDVVPPNVRNFVLCLTNDFSPVTSSCTAALAESLPTYRIPIHRFTRSSTINPKINYSILNEYANGSNIEKCVKNNLITMEKFSGGTVPFRKKQEDFSQMMEKLNS